jgi:hypothetical protein
MKEKQKFIPAPERMLYNVTPNETISTPPQRNEE